MVHVCDSLDHIFLVSDSCILMFHNGASCADKVLELPRFGVRWRCVLLFACRDFMVCMMKTAGCLGSYRIHEGLVGGPPPLRCD